MEAEEVMDVIRRDIPFYEKSGGGVTFSGGEALLQEDFLTEVLEMCRDERLHTVVDTAGDVDYKKIERVLSCTDMFLFDIKAVDEETHKKGTGSDNRRILENLERVLLAKAKVTVRIPVIPCFNDNQSEMDMIADVLKRLPPVSKIELLSFHRLGAMKYEGLGRKYEAIGLTPPNEARMAELLASFIGICDHVEAM
jgi:pyruvate formate lyase activating enzyme